MKLKSFDKTQKRILLERLEIFYAHLLNDWSYYRNNYMDQQKPTTQALVDRRYRTKLKAIEVILHLLGSNLFEHGEKPPSIRKTRTLKSGNNSTEI